MARKPDLIYSDALKILYLLLQDPRTELRLRTERRGKDGIPVKNCFTGAEAVDALCRVLNIQDRAQVVTVANRMLNTGYIGNLPWPKGSVTAFRDDKNCMYFLRPSSMVSWDAMLDERGGARTDDKLWALAFAKILSSALGAVFAGSRPAEPPPTLLRRIDDELKDRDKETEKEEKEKDKERAKERCDSISATKGSELLRERDRPKGGDSVKKEEKAKLAEPARKEEKAKIAEPTKKEDKDKDKSKKQKKLPDSKKLKLPEEDEEDEEEEQDVIYMAGSDQIKAATFDKLVEKLTAQDIDFTWIKCFLLTFRAWTTPISLLHKLIERYNQSNSADKTTAAITQLRVFSLLKTWLDGFWDDFAESAEMKDALVGFLSGITAHQQTINVLKNVFEKKLKLREEPPAAVPASPQRFSSQIAFEDLDTADLAIQLTLYEFELFSQIKAKELVNLGWSKKDKEKLAPNVLKMIEHTNRMIMWVVSEITSRVQLKARVNTLQKFIQLGQKFRELNNFNGVVWVVSGLNTSAVHRLKLTWEQLDAESSSAFGALDYLVSHQGSFKNYRAALRTAVQPTLPYLGIYLTDLTFIEEGNKNEIGSGMINWNKKEDVATWSRTFFT